MKKPILQFLLLNTVLMAGFHTSHLLAQVPQELIGTYEVIKLATRDTPLVAPDERMEIVMRNDGFSVSRWYVETDGKKWKHVEVYGKAQPVPNSKKISVLQLEERDESVPSGKEAIEIHQDPGYPSDERVSFEFLIDENKILSVRSTDIRFEAKKTP